MDRAKARRWFLGGGLAVALHAPPAEAGDADGFALQPFDPSAASDRFFAVPDATAYGDLAVSARADGMYAYKRLLSGTDPVTGEPRDVVTSQLSVFAGATLTVDDRFLFGLSMPVALSQAGDHPSTPDGAAVGDLVLDARFAVLDFGRAVRLAPEIDLTFPTGSQEKLTGDGTFGAHARALLSGEDGPIIYALDLGYRIRDPKRTPRTVVGPGATFGFAFGVQMLDDRLQLAAELQGSTTLNDDDGPFNPDTSPIFVLGGVKFRVASLVVGAAAGPSLTRATGNSPRGVLSLGYVPRD